MHYFIDKMALCITQFDVRNISNSGQTALRVPSVTLCIPHAEPELTVRLWFRVLNSYEEKSAYPGLVVELVKYKEKNLRFVGFYQMNCCTDKSGKTQVSKMSLMKVLKLETMVGQSARFQRASVPQVRLFDVICPITSYTSSIDHRRALCIMPFYLCTNRSG